MVVDLTADNFQHEVMDSPVPVLVDFWSPGCGPCRRMAPVIAELAREADGRYRVGKVNVWDEPDLAGRFPMNLVPTLLLFKDGKVIHSLVGYQDRRRLLEALQPALEARS